MRYGEVICPFKFQRLMWPDVNLYREQRTIIKSVRDNKETFVVAGNKLGKDFVTAYIVLWFFLSRHPCRIVTTSADYSQLESVLWGEIRRFIQSSKYPLTHDKGGPLVVNHLHLRKIVNKQICGVSYCLGRVAAKGEGMLGHHVTQDAGTFVDDGIPRTLFVGDEASAIDDDTYEKASTWFDVSLLIGNPYGSSGRGRGVFEKAVKAGDIPMPASSSLQE